MRNCVLLLAVALSLTFVGAVEAQSVDDQIAEAVLPLPESLRSGATVVTYDTEGNSRVLREGTNTIVCQPDGPADGFSVQCYHESRVPTRNFQAALRAQGKSDEEVQAGVSAAQEAGTLQALPSGSMHYRLQGDDAESASLLWTIRIPGATHESTGLPTEPGDGTPWLMRAGTPAAHVMIPGRR